jgi:hypothetical protein
MADADTICEMLIRFLVLGHKDVPKSTHAPLCITEDLAYLDYESSKETQVVKGKDMYRGVI